MDMPLPNAVTSDLIGSIYECAIDPLRWADTLNKLREALDFHVAYVAHMAPGGLRAGVASGIEPEWFNRLEQYETSFKSQWQWDEEITARDAQHDHVAVVSREIPIARRRTAQHHREWARPLGIGDSMLGVSACVGDGFDIMVFGQAAGAGVVTQTKVDALRLFLPHLKRAAEIQRRIDQEATAAATFDAVLDSLSNAVVLLDANLRIAHANRAAEELLVTARTVRAHSGVLSLSAPGATAILSAAVAEVEVSGRSITVPITSRHGDARALYVLPLHPGLRHPGLSPRATVAIFITPGATQSATCVEAVRVLFQLTATETAVLEHIAAGHDAAQTARLLGIGYATVRTHLLRVFDKTGTHRQADLVALVSAFALPLRT